MNPTVLLALLLVFPAVALGCANPDGGEMKFMGSADGKSYFMVRRVRGDWAQARQFCQAAGMQLGTAQTPGQLELWRSITDPDFELCSFWTAGKANPVTPDDFFWDGTSLKPPTDGIGWRNDFPIPICLLFGHGYEESYFEMSSCMNSANAIICEL